MGSSRPGGADAGRTGAATDDARGVVGGRKSAPCPALRPNHRGRPRGRGSGAGDAFRTRALGWQASGPNGTENSDAAHGLLARSEDDGEHGADRTTGHVRDPADRAGRARRRRDGRSPRLQANERRARPHRRRQAGAGSPSLRGPVAGVPTAAARLSRRPARRVGSTVRRALVPDLAALDGSGNQRPSASLRVVAQSALLPATLLGRLLLALLRPMNVRWLVDATVAESAIAVAVGVPAVPQANSAAAEGTAGSCLTGEFHFSKAMCVSFPAVVTLRRPRTSEEPCGFREQAMARSPSAEPGRGR